MHLDDIRRVLQHCYNRQTDWGTDSAFRFQLIVGPKRKLLFANSRTGLEYHRAESEQNVPTGSRKKKGKGKQQPQELLDGLAPIDPIEPTPPLTLNQAFEYEQLLTPQDPGPSNINRMP